jgi:type I restriction enzyme S subunit
MSPIPPSWVECNLGDITADCEQKIPASADRFTYIDIGSIDRQSKAIESAEEISGANAPSRARKVVRSGDTLVSMTRPNLNAVALVNESHDGQIASTGFDVLRPILVDPRWIYYLVRSSDFVESMCDLVQGALYPAVRSKDVRSFTAPLAPVEEQKRITDKLDSLLLRLDSCRERLDRVPAILQQFRQSVLAAATSGKLTEVWRSENSQIDVTSELNERVVAGKQRRGVQELLDQSRRPRPRWNAPANWAWESAASLLSRSVFIDLKDGNHGSNHPVIHDFTENGLPFITAAQVNDFAIDYEGAYKIEGKPLEKLRVGFAQKDDVILTHKGSIGRVAIADRNCVLTPQTTYYRLDQSIISPAYLMYYLASAPFVEQLDEIKSQTTRDFVPISQQYSLWHLIPPIREQEEIVRQVSSHFTRLRTLEAAFLRATEHAERITPSLLYKAFRGELVPQSPDDEPASVLLERIREQRQTSRTINPKQTTKQAPRAPRKKAAMTKSRFDDDVQGKPYLAGFLKGSKKSLSAEDLFKKANLPLVDFYKQLDFEVKKKLIVDRDGQLEAA